MRAYCATLNLVGHTADLLLEVDEEQDVDVEKFDRDFRPMAALTVYYGTPWGPRSLLEQAKAAHRAAERARVSLGDGFGTAFL